MRNEKKQVKLKLSELYNKHPIIQNDIRDLIHNYLMDTFPRHPEDYLGIDKNKIKKMDVGVELTELDGEIIVTMDMKKMVKMDINPTSIKNLFEKEVFPKYKHTFEIITIEKAKFYGSDAWTIIARCKKCNSVKKWKIYFRNNDITNHCIVESIWLVKTSNFCGYIDYVKENRR